MRRWSSAAGSSSKHPSCATCFYTAAHLGWGQKRDILLEDAEVERVLHVLEHSKKAGFFAAMDHAASVRKKLRSTATCPKCGGKLLPRVAKRGPMPGSRFLGCSNYPAC